MIKTIQYKNLKRKFQLFPRKNISVKLTDFNKKTHRDDSVLVISETAISNLQIKKGSARGMVSESNKGKFRKGKRYYYALCKINRKATCCSERPRFQFQILKSGEKEKLEAPIITTGNSNTKVPITLS